MDLYSFFSLSNDERMKEVRSTRCKESWDILPGSVQNIGIIPEDEDEQTVH